MLAGDKLHHHPDHNEHTLGKAVLMSPAGGRRHVGRRKMLDDAVSRLSRKPASNVAVIGDAGIGKSAFIHEVLAQVEQHCHVVQLRPSPLTAGHQYGALSFLLEDSEGGPGPHPVQIISSLRDKLHQQAGDRTVVIVIDDISQLDDFSAIVLSELTCSGAVRIFVSCRDFARIPAAVSAMWRDGLLHRIELSPLQLDECREYLELELEAKVSAPVLHTLASTSGGNPLILLAMCEDLKEAGQILLRDGVWVLQSDRVEYGRHASNAMSAILAGFEPGEMEVIDLLSLAGSMPLLLLLRVTSGSDVDLLQEKGVLTVEQRREHNARLTSELLCNSGRWRLGAGRRWQLYQKLLAAVDSENDLPLASLRHGEWIIGFGGSLDPQLAYSAAHEANAGGHPHLALQLAECSSERTAGLAAETVNAMAALGDHRGAAALLEDTAEELPAWTAVDSTEIKVAEARYLQHASGQGAYDVLKEAALLLEPALQFENLSPELLYSHQTLAVAEAGLASFEGRFADNAEALPLLYADAGDSMNFKAQIGSYLCEAWAVTGRQDQAIELAAELLQLRTDPRLNALSRRIVQQHVVETYAVTGTAYTQELFESGKADVTPRYPGALPAELLNGLAHARQGRTSEALNLLSPAISQLNVYDPFAALPLATSAAAYCSVVEQRIDGVPAAGLPASRPIGSWKMRRMRAHFNALALAESGAKAEAVEELTVLSQDDRRHGASAYEMLAYYHLARLGDASAADRLLAVAAGMRGPFVELCTIYAKGLASQDLDMLIEAAELAQRQRNVPFCSEAADAALRLAAASHDRSRIRQIQRSLRIKADARGIQPGANPLERLTAREREVAHRAALGNSNKMIAEDMCVSVRTVEGHLYRLYSKLNVTNRSDLARLITNCRPSRQ